MKALNVIFMGRKPVAAKALEWLCSQENIKVVAVITDSHLKVSPTADVARSHNLPLLTRSNLEELLESGALQADIALSVLYWQKIRQPLLNACRLGIINFHPAPLPDYKGTAGYNLAILHELNRWAVSAHYVDLSIDTGPLVDVAWFDINAETETALSLERKSQPMLLDQFKRVTAQAIYSKKPLPSTPNIGGIYVSRAEMEAMKELQIGDDINKKIRAFWFPPYDGAFMMIDGIKCTLVNAEILRLLGDPEASNLFTDQSHQ